MTAPTGVLLAGVALQGVEASADLLARAACAAGMRVRRVALPAPSRSAGSVLCQVRLGREEIHTPFIPDGEADLLLALERLEALRWVHRVRPGGLVAVSDRAVPTPAMRLGLAAAPPDLLVRLRERVERTVEVEADALALRLGRPECAGAVLLGVAAPFLPIPAAAWEEALGELPEPARPAWREALALGRAFFDRLPPDLRRGREPRVARASAPLPPPPSPGDLLG